MIKLEDIFTIKYDNFNPQTPRNINFYFDNYKGAPIVRAVVYLSNTGCQWSASTGGCTMCGTKNSSIKRRLNDTEYIAQLDEVKRQVEKYNKERSSPVRTLHVYNDGLYFNDKEIGNDAREAVYELAKQLNVEKLVVETSVGNISQDSKTNNYLARAVNCLGDIEFEISLGIESTNPLVRALYNKPDASQNIKHSLDIILEKGAMPKAYVLVKGPLMTEKESYNDCVDTIRTLFSWSHNHRIRIELQPVCVLPNTLHKFLMNSSESDPYYWEPPLLSTIFRIMKEFPDNIGNLYCALFARFDQDSPWEFWLTRPHDDKETTFRLYTLLAEHYIARRFDSIREGLALSNEKLWQSRTSKTAPHSLQERVDVIQKMIKLNMSNRNHLHLSDYLKQHIHGNNFIEDCKQHIQMCASGNS